MCKTLETRLATSQARHPRGAQHRLQSQVQLHQRANGVVEIGLAVEMLGHCRAFLIVMRGLDPRVHLISKQSNASPAMTRSNATRIPLRTEPERLSASRPRLFR